jgi:hypothetical protein
VTPAAVGEMFMEDVEDLMGYWVDHPPVHVLVAAYMGVKPAERSGSVDDVRDLVARSG